MNSSDSVIENSDPEADTPLITRRSNTYTSIINSSNETILCTDDNDIIRTSTFSLSRSHSFFNSPGESSPNTANIVQNEELLDVVLDTNPINSDFDAVLKKSLQMNNLRGSW